METDNGDKNDGLDARLQDLRRGRDVEGDIAFSDEEIPTKPETPSSKPPMGGKRLCSHGLELETCEDCRLLHEHGGRYAIMNPNDQEREK